jgi:hypothetical protein
MRLLSILIASLFTASAFAETCKYIDSEGRTIYSNVPVKNARKVTCFQPPQPAAAAPAPAPRSNPESAAPPRTRVDSDTQRQRDDQRRSILESELASEEERLAQAKRELAEQEAVRHGDERNYQRVLERLKPYQEAVAQHEKNIASIKQELGNLR